MRTSFCLLLFHAVLLGPAVAQTAAPVVVEGRQLWVIQAPHGGFSAAERARDVSAGILAVAADRRRSADEIREVNFDTETVLLVSRVYLFSVTDQDARLAGVPRAALMAEHRRRAVEAIRSYRDARSLVHHLRAGGFSLVALVLCLAALAVLRVVHRGLAARDLRLVSRRSGGGPLLAVLRVFESSLIRLARVLLSAAFVAAGAVVLFATASFVLGQFPVTAGLAQAATAAAVKVLGGFGNSIFGYLPNLLVLIAIAVLTYILLRVARTIFLAIAAGRVAIRGFHAEWSRPTYDLVKLLLILFGLVVAFPYLPGGDSPALKGASIFIGVLVSLGSGSAIGNIIAGVILTYMRPFRVGDRVRIADTVGDIVEKSLLVTRIRTIKNVEIIVPNNGILGAHILNYSANARSGGLILHTTVTIGYDAPWPKVHELLIRAALRTPTVLPDPAPFVLQTSLNDFHVSYEINAYTEDACRMAVTYSELHQNIQEEFNNGGVEIMSPTYLSLRDGNTVTIPAGQRPTGYEAPGFRVRSQAAAAGAGGGDERQKGAPAGGEA